MQLCGQIMSSRKTESRPHSIKLQTYQMSLNTPDLPDFSGLSGTRLLMYSEDTIVHVHPLSETVPGV